MGQPRVCYCGAPAAYRVTLTDAEGGLLDVSCFCAACTKDSGTAKAFDTLGLYAPTLTGTYLSGPNLVAQCLKELEEKGRG